MTKASNTPALFQASTANIRRDEVFEALAAACGIDWHRLTPAARGQLNAATRDLRAAGFSAAEITRVGVAYRLEMPRMPCTPSALAKHAPRLRGGGAPRLPRGADAVMRAVG